MKKAVIYVRGHNQEKQEVFCRVYAIDQGYKVLFTTTNIQDVNGCEVLLVSNLSRISRDRLEYEEIVSTLKKKGIEIVSVSGQDNTDDVLRLIRELMK